MKTNALRVGFVALTVGMAGCASGEQSAALERDKAQSRATADAPLGSRIRKKSNMAPVMGATREDLEQARVQAGAIEAGKVNRNGP